MTDSDRNQDRPISRGRGSEGFSLADFMPYRVSNFYFIVSKALGKRYSAEFGVSIPEWRVMAALASFGAMSANEACDYTNMDKVQVSRAVSRMRDAGIVSRRTDPVDRRRSVLNLTDEGRTIFERIVPMALEYEAQLLEVLDQRELEEFCRLMDKIKARADELNRDI